MYYDVIPAPKPCDGPVVIDGSIVAYAAGFANEKWGYKATMSDGSIIEVAKKADLSEVIDDVVSTEKYRIEDNGCDIVTTTVDNMINRIEKNTNRECVIALDGDKNYRKEANLSFPYKGNRDPNHRPRYIKETLEHMMFCYAFESEEYLEGDDIIGSFPEPKIMASIDKDLLQVPGVHYNWKANEFRAVSASQGLKNLAYQLLVGDKVDNIPGIPRIGKIKATKILDSYDFISLYTNKQAVMKIIYDLYYNYICRITDASKFYGLNVEKVVTQWLASNLIALWIQREKDNLQDDLDSNLCAIIHEILDDPI